MFAGARVLRLERAGKRGDSLDVGLLHEGALTALDLEDVAQVARVQDQLLIGLFFLARKGIP